MDAWLVRIETKLKAQEGMELVQVAILIAIAIFLGLIFKDKIGKFVNNVFGDLLKADF
ncbi:MAG: hypothetical protein J6X24_06290 [Firmicutes bacterium]|nr:hypothetical protein [Bacillota bacterium]